MTKLDKILEDFLAAWSDGSRDDVDCFSEAKQSILKHYISYDEVLELIGEDEHIPWLSTNKNATNQAKRNKLRAELKAALKERREIKDA